MVKRFPSRLWLLLPLLLFTGCSLLKAKDASLVKANKDVSLIKAGEDVALVKSNPDKSRQQEVSTGPQIGGLNVGAVSFEGSLAISCGLLLLLWLERFTHGRKLSKLAQLLVNFNQTRGLSDEEKFHFRTVSNVIGAEKLLHGFVQKAKEVQSL